jgi:hypothetical protein
MPRQRGISNIRTNFGNKIPSTLVSGIHDASHVLTNLTYNHVILFTVWKNRPAHKTVLCDVPPHSLVNLTGVSEGTAATRTSHLSNEHTSLSALPPHSLVNLTDVSEGTAATRTSHLANEHTPVSALPPPISTCMLTNQKLSDFASLPGLTAKTSLFLYRMLSVYLLRSFCSHTIPAYGEKKNLKSLLACTHAHHIHMEPLCWSTHPPPPRSMLQIIVIDTDMSAKCLYRRYCSMRLFPHVIRM